MTKYYIGLIPDESLSARCLDYKNQAAELFDSHQAKRSPAHVTIVAPFSSDRQQLELVKNQLSKLVPQYKTFNLKLNGWGHFKEKTIYLGVETTPELTALFKQCNDYLSQLISPAKSKQFIAHISIINRDLSPEKFDQAFEYFSQQPFPATAVFSQLVVFELVIDGNGNYWQVNQIYALRLSSNNTDSQSVQMDSYQ